MITNGLAYPRWEREGRVSRFFLGPSLSVYQVEEIELIGGSMFAASAGDKADLVGHSNPRKTPRKRVRETLPIGKKTLEKISLDGD